MSFYICYLGERKMKTIKVGSTTYYIQDKDDEISVTHELVKQGYTVEEIARILSLTSKQVKKYLQDCW